MLDWKGRNQSVLRGCHYWWLKLSWWIWFLLKLEIIERLLKRWIVCSLILVALFINTFKIINSDDLDRNPFTICHFLVTKFLIFRFYLLFLNIGKICFYVNIQLVFNLLLWNWILPWEILFLIPVFVAMTADFLTADFLSMKLVDFNSPLLFRHATRSY